MKRIPTWLIWVVAILGFWKLGWGDGSMYQVQKVIKDKKVHWIVGNKNKVTGMSFRDEDTARDLAFALNEAHENRKNEEEYRGTGGKWAPTSNCDGTINAPCSEAK